MVPSSTIMKTAFCSVGLLCIEMIDDTVVWGVDILLLGFKF